jgi:zinc protease
VHGSRSFWNGCYTLPLTVCAVLVMATLPAQAQPAQPAQVQVQAPRRDQTVRRDSLPNGLTIIVVENHSVPLATAHIVFRGGAMTQTPDIQGVPHLFEHMLFKSYQGTDAASFGADASMGKASYNGATSDEEVSYTLWFPSNELGGNMGLLATLVRDPFFKDKDLQTERFVVRNEMQRNASQPSFLLADASRRALWGDWYPRKNTIGDDISLFSANAERLKAIFSTWYVPNNAAVIVTGDVEPEKVFSEARKHFGRWRRAADPIKANPVPLPPPLDSTFAFVFTHEVQTVTVRLSWRGPTLTRDAGDVRDAATFADLLNADESQFQRLLVDEGAFQSASMSADINQHGSELTFIGITTLDQLTSSLGTLGAVLGQTTTIDFFDKTALQSDAKRDRVSRALAFEETASLASSLGSAWAVNRLANWTSAASPAADTSASTPESLSAFALKWIANRPYIIGVLTPVGSEQAVSTSVAQYVAFMKQP